METSWPLAAAMANFRCSHVFHMWEHCFSVLSCAPTSILSPDSLDGRPFMSPQVLEFHPVMQQVFWATDCTGPIEDLKYSPSGDFLAVASRDQFIYIYAVDSNRFSLVIPSLCSQSVMPLLAAT
jgi:WD40 repeat protein